MAGTLLTLPNPTDGSESSPFTWSPHGRMVVWSWGDWPTRSICFYGTRSPPRKRLFLVLMEEEEREEMEGSILCAYCALPNNAVFLLDSQTNRTERVSLSYRAIRAKASRLRPCGSSWLERIFSQSGGRSVLPPWPIFGRPSVPAREGAQQKSTLFSGVWPGTCASSSMNLTGQT